MLSTPCRIWYFPAFQYHYCHTSALLNQQLVKCWCCYDQSGLSESVSSPAFTKRGETNAHCFCFRNRYTIIKWFLMPLGDKCGGSNAHRGNWKTNALKSPLGQENSPEDDAVYFQQLCTKLLHFLQQRNSASESHAEALLVHLHLIFHCPVTFLLALPLLWKHSPSSFWPIKSQLFSLLPTSILLPP